MYLSDLKTGEKGVIIKVGGQGGFRKRIVEMGFIKGVVVECILNAPLKDPIDYKLMDYHVSLRRSEAHLVEIEWIESEKISSESSDPDYYGTLEGNDSQRNGKTLGKTIHVAFVGNPNAGKTTFFNVASGSHEHVGNYGGVTVDSKEGSCKFRGYTFRLVDLPGTYSISAYTPEELYVRKYIAENRPDVILNVVDASNLERNLYLTTQLIDMNVEVVVALNMYDELEASGAKLDYENLSVLLNMPMVPTIAKRGHGIPEVFDAVISVYEKGGKDCSDEDQRCISIHHGPVLEPAIDRIQSLILQNAGFDLPCQSRFFAIKLLENDKDIRAQIAKLPNVGVIFNELEKSSSEITDLLNEDVETAVIDAKYGFIAGALRETYTPNTIEKQSTTTIIDAFVTHKLFGYPIFIFFMWLMFQTTFSLGAYPQEWIEMLVEWLGGWVSNVMPDGSLKDLLVDGIIAGVGGVIVFLPNILILYFFISFMEDSGYMARAAFIMDKIMHKMGLHGKSFIPLVMGFGCNVPAIMATRTIESRNSRMITMLINPLMSCSARLPVYLLLVAAFFPNHASLVLLSIYLIGILMAVLVARVFKKYLFSGEDTPFVMELPPYRMPTLKSTLLHMWDKGKQYLKKMGNIILLASIVIWFLGYYPRNAELQHIEQQENSYIGRLGKFIEPVIKPLGFNWKIGIGIVSGIGAKEIVVSTLSVLYTGNPEVEDENNTLAERMKLDKHDDGTPVFTPLVAFCMMLFILFYFPCIAAIVAIKNESGSWKWGLFTIVYTTVLAWVVTFVVYQVGSLFG